MSGQKTQPKSDDSASKAEQNQNSADAKKKKKPSKQKPKRSEGLRETVESIAIAFALAFVFKTFQAEAYVIPTGSMAPTLYGRHKEVVCDGCGFEFAIGASGEIDQSQGLLVGRIHNVNCTNCGKMHNAKDAPVFSGDRIVVNKQVSEFKRFEVVVFKNPEEGHVNYIKRLVGLPGETIRIRKGDLWGKTSTDADWEILRKENPEIQKAIQLTVYDDNYPARRLLEKGWPERWAAVKKSQADGTLAGWIETDSGWKANSDDRTYSVKSTGQDWDWLRYRHFQPSSSDWNDLDSAVEDVWHVNASLIADACSFNEFDPPFINRPKPVAAYWVGDLTINADVNVIASGPDSQLMLQLVEGPQTFNATIQLATGEVTLSNAETNQPDGKPNVLASGAGPVMSSGQHQITFANVDDRICLWVNEDQVTFDQSTAYVSGDQPNPSQADLIPCGIAARDAEISISNLLLQRDIYYRNTSIPSRSPRSAEQSQRPTGEVDDIIGLQRLLTNPEVWGHQYRQSAAMVLNQNGEFCEYKLGDDEYLMFGDNSSMSKDSRLFDYWNRPMNGVFSHRYAVRRKDLIGKALCVFWPHGVPFLNGGKGIAVWNHKSPYSLAKKKDSRIEDPTDAVNYPSVRVPFYPHVSRMKKIR